MSNTHTGSTPALHAVPEREAATRLTGATATAYAKLTGLTGHDADVTVTVTELTLASGLATSTTSKALATLEQGGLAVRTPGGYSSSGGRIPDRWRTTTPGDTSNPTDHNTPDPGTEPAEAAIEKTGPEEDALTTEASPAEPADNEPDDDGAAGQNDSEHSGDEFAPAPQAEPKPPAAPAVPIALPGGKQRLAPGALRQLVLDHLTTHPGEAFTATHISRVIEKSSGAIANCLDKLVSQGIAEQVTDRPRTYRLTPPKNNGA